MFIYIYIYIILYPICLQGDKSPGRLTTFVLHLRSICNMWIADLSNFFITILVPRSSAGCSCPPKSIGSGPPWGQVWRRFKEGQANTGNVAHVPIYICFFVKLNAFVVTESNSFTIENHTMYFLSKLIGVNLLAFWNVFAATCFSFLCTWSSPHYLRCATFFDSGREQ